ncbi:helix-turn-helix domain-containing protein [Paractinoplanes brasiliensis]|uniref:Helix-turn-helix protein n=1 Tax=Paractinoplanes brasiliensis TaxID=52695 RepID=A0A4R6JXR1_9ACTN|nr:helix-turn-helix transcriptional regulator [Actinoplanes brasiliensis]TDO41509.1 helix-turn-helix protein [Actinoplanes brasiliensis]GID27206.1 transcriptional regulator [Actinoplanes brasiliensis]
MADDPFRGNGDPSSAPVGVALQRMRVEKGITGKELGALVRMSQSKISRIENSHGPVSPSDVGRLARALDAPPAVVAQLVERAELARNRVTDMRTSAGSVSTMQRTVERTEADVSEFRVFQPDVVMGLAQTDDYARAILEAAHEIRKAVFPDAARVAIPEAVSARVRRQIVLEDPDRRFYFLLTESVLGKQVVPPDLMLAQIARLRRLAARPNVTLKVIPADAKWTLPHVHGFELLDDKDVVIDIYNTSIDATGREDVALYRYVFDRLDESATSEVGPILERYRRHYLDLID